MDILGKDDLDKADDLPSLAVKVPVVPDGVEPMTEKEFEMMLAKMQNPVEAQKELAVQIKSFLDHQMEKEMKEKGYLTDFTRRWVTEFNQICEKIQKALYGDKTVNLHVVKVSHSDIAKNIRKHGKIKDAHAKVDID